MDKPYIGPKNRGSALGVGGRRGSRSRLCIRGRGAPRGHTLSMGLGCPPPEMDPQGQRGAETFPGEVRCIRPKGVSPVRRATAIAGRKAAGSPAPPRAPAARWASPARSQPVSSGFPAPEAPSLNRAGRAVTGRMRSQDPTGIGRRRRARGRARALLPLPQTRVAPPQPGPPRHLSCGSCASPSRGAASPRPPSSLLRQRLLRLRAPPAPPAPAQRRRLLARRALYRAWRRLPLGTLTGFLLGKSESGRIHPAFSHLGPAPSLSSGL